MALMCDKMVIKPNGTSMLSSNNIIGKHIYEPTLKTVNHYLQLLHKTHTQYGFANLDTDSLI